jgi:hypothetical protein
MSKTGDQRKQLLSDAELPNAGFLRLGQQRKECNNLLAKKFSLAAVG